MATASTRTGGELPPARRIGELEFRADGRFSVTWTPFEIYRDNWGRYSLDIPAGRLALRLEGGNYVPPDVDGEGTIAIEGSRRRLVLRDLWLGSTSRAPGDRAWPCTVRACLPGSH